MDRLSITGIIILAVADLACGCLDSRGETGRFTGNVSAGPLCPSNHLLVLATGVVPRMRPARSR